MRPTVRRGSSTTGGGLPVDLVDCAEFHRRALERLNRSAQTLRLYRVYQDSFLAWLLDNGVEPTLDVLNPQFVREWQVWLRTRSNGKRGGLAAEKQGVMTLKTWSRFLRDNDVYKVGQIAYDPLERLKVPRVQKLHRKPFTEDELRRLSQAASAGPNPIRDRALLLLMVDTGCRVGELCSATLADLDLAYGSITFLATKNGTPRRVIFRVPDRRDGGPALSALRNWLKVREARPGVEALFTTRERYALSTRRVREIFAELGRVARVPDCHPHRTRHTSASEFLAQRPGAELQLRSRLGHIDKSALSDYITWSDPAQVEAAEVASLSARWRL